MSVIVWSSLRCTLGQTAVYQEQPCAVVAHELQLLHHLVDGRLLIHLLCNEPLEEGIGGVIAFAGGQVD